MQRRLKFYWLAVITTIAATLTIGPSFALAYLVGSIACVALALAVFADYMLEVGPGPAVYSCAEPTEDELIAIFVTCGRVSDYETALARLLERGRIAAACRDCDRFTITAENPGPCSGCGEPKEWLSDHDALDFARARHRAENLRLWKGRARSWRKRIADRLR